MHRFMNHLDDLAGLDIQLGRAEQLSGKGPSAVDRRQPSLISLLRTRMAGQPVSGSKCRGDTPPLADPASPSSRQVHVARPRRLFT